MTFCPVGGAALQTDSKRHSTKSLIQYREQMCFLASEQNPYECDVYELIKLRVVLLRDYLLIILTLTLFHTVTGAEDRTELLHTTHLSLCEVNAVYFSTFQWWT